MTAKEILAELKPLGSESYKRMLMRNHGVKEPFFGVKIGDLKKFQKRFKVNHELALDLYETGNYDAKYLAGLIADDAKMTKADLERWVEKANGGALPGATVPWVAAGSPHGWDLALKWIESPTPHVAVAGWYTLANIVALKPDTELDIPALKRLIDRVQKTIRKAPGPVTCAMNLFLISAGCYVAALTEPALIASEQIGVVTADLGENSCEIPFAPDRIRKAKKSGAVGKKRKTVKC
jgi:3-methyladenine DNA glycosylase AlkD